MSLAKYGVLIAESYMDFVKNESERSFTKNNQPYSNVYQPFCDNKGFY
jgi:hypothetical protein